MYTSIENLRDQFESSNAVRKFKFSFNEYAFLIRLQEGMKAAHVFESLYLSASTIYRCKVSITKKFKANSFEQALIKAGEALFSKK